MFSSIEIYFIIKGQIRVRNFKKKSLGIIHTESKNNKKNNKILIVIIIIGPRYKYSGGIKKITICKEAARPLLLLVL